MIYIPISFARLTDILATIWSEGNRQIRISAKKKYHVIISVHVDGFMRKINTDKAKQNI